MPCSALLLAAVLALAPPHANSFSVSRVEVGENGIGVRLDVQTLSVMEVLPALDTNGDSVLDAEELRDGHELFEAYLLRHYVLRADGQRLDGRLVGVTETDPDRQLAFVTQRLATELAYETESAPGELPAALELEMSLFETTSPGHKDACTLDWPGHPPVEWLLDAERPIRRFSPAPDRPARVARSWLGHGAGRAATFELGGFVVVLVLAAASAGAALRAAAAYVGIVLVTAAATLAIGDVGEVVPARILVLATALSMPYLAAESALSREARAPRAEALVFALVHGVTLALEVEHALRTEREPLTLLAGGAWLLGAGATLLALAAVATLAVRVLPGARPEDGAVAPARLRRGASAVLALVGLALFVQLAWFAA